MLVPRPETELIVEVALEHFADRDAVAQHPRRRHRQRLPRGLARGRASRLRASPRATFHAAALAVARRNAERHGVADRIRFFSRTCSMALEGPST